MISFEHVRKQYGIGLAVADLCLEIGDGEIVVLAGPSGCGKTTTLKMINRLIEPTSGRITIDGKDTREQKVETLRRSIGYVIQHVGLFPHLTIAQNVATVPRLLGWDQGRIGRRVDELLDLVGLPPSEYGPRLPSQLSGGQRQRVGVARALGADPPILLMDEPFGAIDPITRERLQSELLHLQSLVRKTIVFVTHDIDEAIKIADRVVLLNNEARIMQYATPSELLAHPASPFVEEFLGTGRLVRRLGLIPLRSVDLSRNGGSAPATTVDIGGSLRDALDALLRAPDGRVAVMDGSRPVGTLDADTIRLAAR
ncbi:MAG: ABC transporter ATP-binding protein [Dehalococcoidia bacterium]